MYNELRGVFIDNGYVPVPVVPQGKRPAVTNWLSPSYEPPINMPGCGIGIRCGEVSAIDIDVHDSGIVNDITRYIMATYGNTCVRVGQPPKAMLFYRNSDARTRKRKSNIYDIGHIEIMGSGQEIVAYGIHPDTAKPYQWYNSEIKDIALLDLPLMDADAADNIFSYYDSIMVQRGYAPIQKHVDQSGMEWDPEDPLMAPRPIGVTIERMQGILDGLSPDCSRDEWRNIGMALHHEFSGAAEALDLWDTWSAKGMKYKEGEPAYQWESFGRYLGRPLTAAYLLKLGKKEEDKRAKVSFFQTLSWSIKRFSLNPPEVPVVVPDFLPQGIVSLLYSAGGAGKSTLALYLSACIAMANSRDTVFLNWPVRPGRVVILTAEDPDLILNRRLNGVLGGMIEPLIEDMQDMYNLLDRHLHIVSTFGHSVPLFSVQNNILCTTEYYDSFLECLGSLNGVSLIMIDTKTRYSPSEGGGNVMATQEITHYERIAQQTGASVMLLHHTNKSSRDGSQSGATAYRDVSGLFDTVRAAWYLRGLTEAELKTQELTEEKGSFLLLENSKNNYIELHEDVLIHRVGFSYTPRTMKKKISKEARGEKERETSYNTVRDYLTRHAEEWVSQSTIIDACRELKIGRRKVIDALAELSEDGVVERLAGSNYRKFKIVEIKKEVLNA